MKTPCHCFPQAGRWLWKCPSLNLLEAHWKNNSRRSWKKKKNLCQWESPPVLFVCPHTNTWCFHFTKILAMSAPVKWTLWGLLQNLPPGYLMGWPALWAAVDSSAPMTHQGEITNLWLTIWIPVFSRASGRTRHPVFNHQWVPPCCQHSPAPWGRFDTGYRAADSMCPLRITLTWSALLNECGLCVQ